MTTTPPTTETYRLDLPWDRPPLNANHRLHWSARHRLTADIRQTVGWLARAAHIQPAEHCTVTLVWAPGDHRRRDVDNLVPTSKACVDGLRDAGVILDDTPAHVDHRMPQIHPPPAPVGMWLTVEITTR